jgi:mRNA interferase MazF
LPKRGEVWLVNLDPTVGAEIRKTRPAVVVSSDAVGILPVKLIAPITDWQDRYAHTSWHVRIDPDVSNGLSKASAVDALQLRGVDRRRLVKKLGRLSAATMGEIAAVIASIVEYQ